MREQVLAVLGDQDGGARSDRGLERGEQRPRPVRIELREGLVEDQQARTHGEDAGEREALAFAAGEGGDRPAAERRDPAHLERTVDTAQHLGAPDAEVLQAEGGVTLDAGIDRLELRVLEDEADVPGELAGGGAQHVPAQHPRAAADHPAVEVRDEPVADAQQR